MITITPGILRKLMVFWWFQGGKTYLIRLNLSITGSRFGYLTRVYLQISICNLNVKNLFPLEIISKDSDRLFIFNLAAQRPILNLSHPMLIFLFLIMIHSMQGWTATTRQGVTRKRSIKRLQHIGNLFRKNLQLKDVC